MRPQRKLLIFIFAVIATTLTHLSKGFDSDNFVESTDQVRQKVSDFRHELDGTEETIDFYDDILSDKETYQNHKLGHPRLMELDRFCTSLNTVDNVCTIANKTMRLTHSTRYTTEKSIVIDAAKIKCLD